MSKKPKRIEDSEEYFKRLDQYWRATNYLAAAQLYMKENPLLRKPLTRDQVKAKIVGHWGTVPGQNFVYTQPLSLLLFFQIKHSLIIKLLLMLYLL